MMRPYFAIGRSRCLIHTYSHDGITRGRFKFYSYATKRKLYHIGKKEYNYRVKADFAGRFTDTFGKFWNEKDYDDKKEDAIRALSKDCIKVNKWEERMKKAVTNMRELGISYNMMSNYLKVAPSTLKDWVDKVNGERYSPPSAEV